jgi:hypothetical protein
MKCVIVLQPTSLDTPSLAGSFPPLMKNVRLGETSFQLLTNPVTVINAKTAVHPLDIGLITESGA